MNKLLRLKNLKNLQKHKKNLLIQEAPPLPLQSLKLTPQKTLQFSTQFPSKPQKQQKNSIKIGQNFKKESLKTPIQLQKRLRKEAQKSGLYDPQFEKDACGFGFLANIEGKKSHKLIQQALQALTNLTHRAAVASDGKTGDGAGIMIQIPHEFFQEQLQKKQKIDIGPEFQYAVAMLFLPQDEIFRNQCFALVEEFCEQEGLEVVAVREVPVDSSCCGVIAEETRPFIAQVFIREAKISKRKKFDEKLFNKKLYLVRRQVENAASKLIMEERFDIVSFHNRTIVYKGLLMPEDLSKFYLDLQNEEFVSALAMIHSRFSTNTFPSWERAHPNRYLAHNGEINTIKGNTKWMDSRESLFETKNFSKEEFQKLFPICDSNLSDSGRLDNALELLLHSGRSIEEAMSILVPEAWQENSTISQELRDYYKYNSLLMEPWDGPAALAFTDGKVIGAMLDRNGLRPSRYVITKDGLVVVSSEIGVLHDLPEEDIIKKRRIRSGNMILIDTEKQQMITNEKIKEKLSKQKPYGKWLQNLTKLKDLNQEIPVDKIPKQYSQENLRQSQFLFGYVLEDVRNVIRPMGIKGSEAIGSMGNDTPLAVLSQRPQLIYRYFKQSFAQVTNPPIDPIREKIVMSLTLYGGRSNNIFEDGPQHCKKLIFDKPILTNQELLQIQNIQSPDFQSQTIHATISKNPRQKDITPEMLEKSLEKLCLSAEQAVDNGYSIIILSDRNHDQDNIPIPILLACSAVHNDLSRKKKRSKCCIVLESAEPRDTMHMACLLGYGAIAINPYMIEEILIDQHEQGLMENLTLQQCKDNYISACCKGIEKIMSKVGISTLQSYQGSQIFEAIGLNQSFIDQYFTGTVSKISGIGIESIAADINTRYHNAFKKNKYKKGDTALQDLQRSGDHSWRKSGEYHQFNPNTLFKIQEAVRLNSYEKFKEFTKLSDEKTKQLCTIRGLFEFKKLNKSAAIPIEEVESVQSIVKRFRTGAMSFGSISKEAHETLAIAMNTLGGKSNSGEGGETPERYGTIKNSGIKQVASGRFGVTSTYLNNCEEIQIKMAQGAKPGEGGHLPGTKVDENIAKTRFSIPGVDLISPPPHHDIYSIEDLSQLIYDLKNANDKAYISVKLVSEAGVGTVAAGVAKAKANSIVISGDQGGTGASPITSITNAGTPWEIGLAEAHQTLLINGLRNQVQLETDGGLKTGRDIVIAAMLGADQFGFGTISLIVEGCIMMRQCHLNTCPVGVATQDPELRKKFKGKPEHVINYFWFVATEVREIMSQLGIRKFDQMIGRTDLLDQGNAIQHYKKYDQLDLSPILNKLNFNDKKQKLHFVEHEANDFKDILDTQIIKDCQEAINNKIPVSKTYNLKNTDRTVGTRLSSEISKIYGDIGLPANTINLTFYGHCGQSFGAFMTNGITTRIYGDANDYLGKGLCGGEIILTPHQKSTLIPHENTIVGNVVLFGATSGKVFINGRAGERFAVRNSGATAVVEAVGNHGCEYMTGGKVVVLGETGRNFGAGMSGGMAYVYDQKENFLYTSLCDQGNVIVETPDEEDAQFLNDILQEYYEKTQSQTAKQILQEWSKNCKHFVKVISPDYKKALKMQQIKQDKKQVEKTQKIKRTIEHSETLNRKVQDRIKDFKEVEQNLGEEKTQAQASRCMDCGVPFCHKGCPLGNNIPDFNNFVNEGRWDKAVSSLTKTNNFPEITGRICPAPCEDICTMNIDGSPVSIRQIERQVSQYSKNEGQLYKPMIANQKTGKKVAIVGSGPAGMACAQQLARMGHDVVVYERDDRIGGLLRYGIPSFKLEKKIINERYKQISKEGVRFETEVNVGVDISESELYKQYDAVVLATGSQMPRDVQLPGRDAEGIHQAMEFLVQQNKITEGDIIPNHISAKGKHVIVIGGGDTGSDCIGTAIRQEALSVTQLAYTPKPPMKSEDPELWFNQPLTFKNSTSHEEGAQREFSVQSKEFVKDENGKIKGINLVRLEPIDKKINGKRVIKEIPNSEFFMEGQLILFAVGFLGPEINHPLFKKLNIDFSPQGNILANKKYEINQQGIFACGDAKRGQSLVVWAIAEGRETAYRVNKFLEKKSLKLINYDDLLPDGLVDQEKNTDIIL